MQCVYRIDNLLTAVEVGRNGYDEYEIETFDASKFFHVNLYDGGDLWIANDAKVSYWARCIIYVGGKSGKRFEVSMLDMIRFRDAEEMWVPSVNS